MGGKWQWGVNSTMKGGWNSKRAGLEVEYLLFISSRGPMKDCMTHESHSLLYHSLSPKTASSATPPTHRKRGENPLVLRNKTIPPLKSFHSSNREWFASFMLVFRRCRPQAAGESCSLLWWFCWSSRSSTFGSAATAEPGRCGFFREKASERWERDTQREEGRAMRICSASTSTGDLLAWTEPQKDLTRAKEEYPVAQILFTTSRIISLQFRLSSFFVLLLSPQLISKIPAFFSLFLIVYRWILRYFRQKTEGILVS